MARILIVTLALVANLQVVPPQIQTGTLTGVITDRTGDIIPGATITVVVDGAPKKAISNASGQYRLEGLPAGMHSVQVRLPGFLTGLADVKISGGQETLLNVAIGIATAHSNQPSSGSDPTDPRLAAGVYEAILRRVYRGSIPSRLIIVTTSLIQPYLDDADWPAALNVVPPILRQISRTAEAQHPVSLRSESLPAGARLVERAGPSDVPFTAFSRVFLSDDGLSALVVFEHVCGNLCAEGTIAFLTRTTPSSSWTIRSSSTFWMS